VSAVSAARANRNERAGASRTYRRVQAKTNSMLLIAARTPCEMRNRFAHLLLVLACVRWGSRRLARGPVAVRTEARRTGDAADTTPCKQWRPTTDNPHCQVPKCMRFIDVWGGDNVFSINSRVMPMPAQRPGLAPHAPFQMPSAHVLPPPHTRIIHSLSRSPPPLTPVPHRTWYAVPRLHACDAPAPRQAQSLRGGHQHASQTPKFSPWRFTEGGSI